MKRCPTCKKTFTDRNLSFCIDDGTPLLPVVEPLDASADASADEATVVRPSPGVHASESEEASATSKDDRVPAYKPPGAYVPPGSSGPPSKRKTWPLIVAILAVVLVLIVGLGLAGAIFVPRMLRAKSNTNNVGPRSNFNQNPNGSDSNSSSNANENENANDNLDVEDTTPPPKDTEKVLGDLKNLEDEWTVANINADKKKLDRILADDYVGTTEGRAQGKAEYLKSIKRDTVIQHWEFEDLKTSLSADRASLTGILRLVVKDQQGQDQEVVYQFTDKFVWRAGRWQAVASEVNPMK